MTIETILVVDDEVIMRNFLTDALKRKGFQSVGVDSGEKALKLIQEESFDLIITDMKMSGMDGIQLLKKIKEHHPNIIVIVITAYGTIESGVEAIKSGAFHYMIKPFSLESLIATIEKAAQHNTLVEENHYLREQVCPSEPTKQVIAESPIMKKIIEDVQQIAKSNSNIFISGESGTGKEIIAHLIHHYSNRSNYPFIKVNCAAVPEPLIESEFFGHEKGSFTGAANKRLGRFELANHGSLLLDEITEIPLTLQAKLLRITQEQEFERVGGSKSIKVDVRLISTSNRNFKEAIADKVLREDLYYRLNVIPIHLPSLRERKEDIIPLAEYFIQRMCRENHTELKKLTNEAKEKLLKYSWPGNVRELANVIERAIVMSQTQKIVPSLLYLDDIKVKENELEENSPGEIIQSSNIKDEKQLILEAMQRYSNRTKAAESLGISTQTLRNKLKEHQL